jgi:hypothetical protein
MKNILTGKVIIASLVIASGLLCASIMFIILRRPAAVVPDLTPAYIALTIFPAPSSTPHIQPSTLTPFPSTPLPTNTPAPGEFAIDVYVQVATGVDALNLRAEPGLNTAPLSLAFNSEVFLVTGGPELADGYTWWYLTASYDASRSGWAAQDFLTVIPSP